MSFNRENYRRIREEYQDKYRLAREDAQRRTAEAEALFPALREIHLLLRETGLRLMKLSIDHAGDDAARTRALEELRQRNAELQARKEDILRAGGYPADYTALRYRCETCGDTGYLDNGKMCDCMRKQLILAGYASSGLGALLQEQRFDNYSTDYFRADERVYRTMCNNVAFLRQYAASFGAADQATPKESLLLIGGTGLGKTHLSTAVAREVLDAGCDVLYTTAVSMVGEFELQRFGNSGAAGDIGTEADTARYFECDLLIVDDLGTEVINQFTVSALYNVINTRLSRKLPTIISTNFGQDELRRRYWDRITSRLFGEYRLLLFLGTDVRAQKVKGIR